MLGAD